jgi:hypothetical protein
MIQSDRHCWFARVVRGTCTRAWCRRVLTVMLRFSLVGCNRVFSPSHSVALRTLNATRDYMMLSGRASQHDRGVRAMACVFKHYRAEDMEDTGMWTITEGAAIHDCISCGRERSGNTEGGNRDF